MHYAGIDEVTAGHADALAGTYVETTGLSGRSLILHPDSTWEMDSFTDFSMPFRNDKEVGRWTREGGQVALLRRQRNCLTAEQLDITRVGGERTWLVEPRYRWKVRVAFDPDYTEEEKGMMLGPNYFGIDTEHGRLGYGVFGVDTVLDNPHSQPTPG